MKINFINKVYGIIALLLTLCLNSCGSSSSETDPTPEPPTPVTPEGQRWLTQHPRLLVSAQEIKAAKDLSGKDADVKELYNYEINKARAYALLPQIDYKVDEGGRMLTTAGTYMTRLITMALAYRLTGSKLYLNAVEKSLKWICAYPDWHPTHYLDTSYLTVGVAIAYDWLYDDLSDETKTLVSKSIYEKALSKALEEYKKPESSTWVNKETNWNVTCHTAMVLGALAVAEDYPEAASTVLDKAITYMPTCLKFFKPDGVWYEGNTYWIMTTEFLTLYLRAIADNDPTHDSIAALPGIKETGTFFLRTLQSSGDMFCYADGHSTTPVNYPTFFYFAKSYSQPELAQWCRAQIKKSIESNSTLNEFFFLSLPWYDTETASSVAAVPSLQVFRNDIADIAVLCGDQSKAGALKLITKGGEPMKSHQQMDAGTFVVGSDGIDWTAELGAENYNVTGFWENSVGGRRWNYFRNNNFSHNTIAIDKHLHNAAGTAKVSATNYDKPNPSVTIDMSSMLSPLATSAHRTFTLVDDYTIDVTDEVQLAKATSTINWIAGTTAAVQVNCNTVCLTKNGKNFWIKIISPENATFSTYAAKTSSTAEYAISGITMLQADCKLPDGKNKVVVRLSSKELK